MLLGNCIVAAGIWLALLERICVLVLVHWVVLGRSWLKRDGCRGRIAVRSIALDKSRVAWLWILMGWWCEILMRRVIRCGMHVDACCLMIWRILGLV